MDDATQPARTNRLTALGQWAAYVVVRLFVCAVQSLSIEQCEQLARRLAYFLTHVATVRRAVIDENLRLAWPDQTVAERRALTEAMWAHLLLLVCEVAHTPRKIHETNWRQHIRMRGGADLCRWLLEDRATLLISAHFGNFELGGTFLGLLGFTTHAVARTLDNPYIARWIDTVRNRGRQHIIPKKGGYDDILRVLQADGTMVLLADQYAGSKGCWVEFFGRPASAHKAIALFALDNDARMVVCYCRRLERPMLFEMGVQAMFDPRTAAADLGSIKQLTQWYTTELERFIRLDPAQYWWLHRRWKDSRPQRKKRAAT